MNKTFVVLKCFTKKAGLLLSVFVKSIKTHEELIGCKTKSVTTHQQSPIGKTFSMHLNDSTTHTTHKFSKYL